MTANNIFLKPNWLATIGLVLDVPALFIVTAGITQVFFGETDVHKTIYSYLTPGSLVIHPVLVLGGMLLAITLNALSVFRVRLEPQPGSLVTTIVTAWKFRNVAVLTLSLFLLGMILLYAFVENFRVVAR